MNIYDTANKLASEIKQSEEYQNFKMAKEVINLNKELKEKIRKFETMRYETQIVQMQTGKQDEEKLKSAKELFSELVQDERINKLEINVVNNFVFIFKMYGKISLFLHLNFHGTSRWEKIKN